MMFPRSIQLETTKRVNVNNISQDHVVRFYSIPNDESYDGSDEKVKEVQDQYRDVVVKIVDQNGNPIAGSAWHDAKRQEG